MAYLPLHWWMYDFPLFASIISPKVRLRWIAIIVEQPIFPSSFSGQKSILVLLFAIWFPSSSFTIMTPLNVLMVSFLLLYSNLEYWTQRSGWYWGIYYRVCGWRHVNFWQKDRCRRTNSVRPTEERQGGQTEYGRDVREQILCNSYV